MQKNIRKIGEAIRLAYHWTKKEDTAIYLVIDNAGGHGTVGTKNKYAVLLEREYNIIIIWQIPNSPETNMLDVGVWASIQSMVEDIRRQLVMRNDELMNSVDKAFGRVGLESKALTNIYNRWIRVLKLIIHGQGDNSLVEECRGKNDNISELVYVGDETQALIACVEQRDDECIEEEEELMEEED